MVDFVSNDASVSHAPTAQATIDILDGWVSILPAELGAATRGFAPLFADERAIWAIDRLGGVRGATILELGPLEGGHTYMLDRAGAKSIIAIEGNKRCYLKCLITKELLGVDSAHLLLGDFVSWLEQDRRRFDVIWATGVLYHMTEPLRYCDFWPTVPTGCIYGRIFIRMTICQNRCNRRLLRLRTASLKARKSDIICGLTWVPNARLPIVAACILDRHGCVVRTS